MDLKKWQKMGYFLGCILYLFILAADWGGLALPDGVCKLGLVILCACLARGRVQAAQALTVVCDGLLLFTKFFVPGVLIFCLVQSIYLWGLLPKIFKSKKQHLMKALPALLFVLLICVCKGPNRLLMAAAGAYALLLAQNTGCALVLACRTGRRNDWLLALGFVLFVGCDISVGLFNSLWPVWAVGRWMWLFYGPSQLLLSLSSHK